MANFRNTRRDAYNEIEQVLSQFEKIIYDISTRAKKQYDDETTKLENCLATSLKNGTEKTNST